MEVSGDKTMPRVGRLVQVWAERGRTNTKRLKLGGEIQAFGLKPLRLGISTFYQIADVLR